MKAVLVFILVLLAAVTAVAYGQAGAADGGITSAALPSWAEPAALLLSGGALLGIAGAVRRFPF